MAHSRERDDLYMVTAESSKSVRRPIQLRAYARSLIALLLLTVWPMVALSGLVLWLAPEGQRSGQLALLFDLTKHQWGDVHFWLSITALCATSIHLLVDWRALCGCLRYLVSAHRELKTQASQ